MSQIYPVKYRGKINAEARVYQQLKDLRSSHWRFFHSVDIARHSVKKSGEIDFVAISRSALFTLEVKGGKLTRRNGTWLANGKEMDESPITQATDNYNALRRYLKKAKLPMLPGGHCCVWPDTLLETHSMEWHQSSIIDKRGMNDLLRALETAEQHFRDEATRLGKPTPTLSEAAYTALCESILPDIVQPLSAGQGVEADKSELVELNRSQSRILDRIFDNPRIVISGPAGSGKTLVAYEACKRLLRENPHWRGAFACQSIYLAKDIQLKVWEDRISDRLEVLNEETMYPFYTRNARGIDLSAQEPGSALTIKIPGYAVDPSSLKEIDSKRLLDFVVVDEGQDIANNIALLTFLNACTKRGLAKCRLLWFEDTQQAIAAKLASGNRRKLYVDLLDHDVLKDCFRYRLDPINYRNPAQIAGKAEKLLGITTEHVFDGNIDPQVTSWVTEDPIEALGRAIMQLERQGVREKDIMVISITGKSVGILEKGLRAGGKNLSYESDVFDQSTGRHHPAGHVRWSRLIDVKGREFPAIIMLDLPDFKDPFDKHFMYVALTRANSLVIALGTREQLLAAKLDPSS